MYYYTIHRGTTVVIPFKKNINFSELMELELFATESINLSFLYWVSI